MYKMDPIIRDIVDFPNYQISENCEIYNKKTGKEMKIYMSNDGYAMIKLCKDKEREHHSVHRLIYEAFNGKIPAGLMIDHVNMIKSDNRLENLRLATRAQNTYNTCARKNNNLGEKYICVDRKKNDTYYHVRIRRYGEFLCHKRFPYNSEGLEEAKKYRDEQVLIHDPFRN